jgi:CelD/BcsL family acetyltransferase involved in cellulose biosynthesis
MSIATAIPSARNAAVQKGASANSEVLVFSAEDMAEMRPFWNSLWKKSSVSWSLARAEQVSFWLEQFGAQRRFAALVVKEADDWIICLPLIDNPNRLVAQAADLPNNSWFSFGGELLVDEDACTSKHWSLLVKKLRTLPWNSLWLERIRVDEPRWQMFAAALKRNGWRTKLRTSEYFGLTETIQPWKEYMAARPSSRDRKRRAKWLEAQGNVELSVHTPISSEDAKRLFRQAMEVENSSWKRETGTSIIAAGLLEFGEKVAVDLARNGELEIAFLEVDKKPIAAMFSCVSHGICHNFKIGYDEAFAKGSPGQIIIQAHLKNARKDKSYTIVDDVGPVQPYTQIWNTACYAVGQLVAIKPTLGGYWFLLQERIRCFFLKKRGAKPQK